MIRPLARVNILTTPTVDIAPVHHLEEWLIQQKDAQLEIHIVLRLALTSFISP